MFRKESRYRRSFLKRIGVLCVSIMQLVFLGSSGFAISASSLNSIRNNRPWYDPTQSCDTSPAAATQINGGSAYIVGDSIAVQTSEKYKSTLSARGLSGVYVNASNGRSIDTKGTSSGNTTSGMEAIDTDASQISKASAVIVALGTNGGVDQEKITKLITRIKELSPGSKIFWVDTMVIGRPDYVATINNSNSAIYGSAGLLGYSVISWAKKVTPTANPSSLTGSEQDVAGYIRQADQFVHLSAAGEDALAHLVADGISVNEAASASINPLCASQCSASSLSFEDGEIERMVFQFFIWVRLTAEQAAGIMGNMAHESGFQPQRLQGTDSGTVTPASNVPRGQSAKAWGLVQWDPAHKLIDPVIAAGKDPNDPKIQLDYLWGQLNNKWPEGWAGVAPSSGFNEKSAGDRVKSAVSIEDGTRAFASYERFAGWTNPNHERYTDRIAASKAYYDMYKGLAPATPPESSGGCNNTATISGIEYPDNLEPHPTLGGKGYFKMPEDAAYTLSGPEQKRYGSKTLIGAIYTVARAYKAAMGESSTVAVGNLNTNYKDPSVSHRWGTAIDMNAKGQKVAANILIPNYDTDATILLGKLWVDTGLVKQILWCPSDNSAAAIMEYSSSKGTPIKVICVTGHKDHFHVDLKNEHRLEEANTY